MKGKPPDKAEFEKLRAEGKEEWREKARRYATFHSFRKRFMAQLMQSNIPPSQISGLLGQKSKTLAEDTYGTAKGADLEVTEKTLAEAYKLSKLFTSKWLWECV